MYFQSSAHFVSSGVVRVVAIVVSSVDRRVPFEFGIL